MKKHLALLPIIFLSAVLLGRAEEADETNAQPPPTTHRLDYVHFDPTAQTVQWGVSEGSVNDDGDFVASGKPTSYSMNLETGVITHAGEDGQLSPDDADNALRVFRALSTLMQFFTEHWNDSDDPGFHDSQGTGSTDSTSPDTRTISAPCPIGRRPAWGADGKLATTVPISSAAFSTAQLIPAASSGAESTTRMGLAAVSVTAGCRRAVNRVFASALLGMGLTAAQLS